MDESRNQELSGGQALTRMPVMDASRGIAKGAAAGQTGYLAWPRCRSGPMGRSASRHRSSGTAGRASTPKGRRGSAPERQSRCTDGGSSCLFFATRESHESRHCPVPSRRMRSSRRLWHHKLMSFGPHCQHRAGSSTHHTLRNASDNNVCQASSTVCGKYDQVDILLAGVADDLHLRRPL